MGKRADTQNNEAKKKKTKNNEASQTPQKQAYTNMVNYILTEVQGQFHKERIIFFTKWC